VLDSSCGHEEVLRAGITGTRVVRIGDTVRRPLKSRSPFVHELLLHLEAKGFDAAPRFLGIDEQGREILSYISGYDIEYVIARGGKVERDVWSDQQIIAAAQLIRRLHDATAGSVLAHREEVVCHNDLSPENTVFSGNDNGLPYAIFDFDMAAPGPQIRDVGYAAWLWLGLGRNGLHVSEQRRRLRLWCDSYGLRDRAAVLSGAEQRQMELINNCNDEVMQGIDQAIEQCARLQSQLNWLRVNWKQLVAQ